MNYEEKKAETNRLIAMLPDVRAELMRIPGVETVTVGIRERNGALEQEILFRVHVDAKLPEAELAPEHIIPKNIRGVPVDVVVKRMPMPETGFDNDDNYEGLHRPVSGGVSISAKDADPDIPATLGCFCRRTTDNKTVFVTNWHVLIRPDGAIGNAVGQPKYRKKCCCVCDRIGSVLDFDETLDIAIGELDSDTPFAPKIRRIMNTDGSVEEEGNINGGEAPVLGDGVFKVGVRTGLTYGSISDIDPARSRVEVTPDAEFDRMSAPGDSGSVYVSLTTRKVIALHRAGNGTQGFGVSFDVVMSKLKIEVIPTPANTAYTVIDAAPNLSAELHEPSGEQLFRKVTARLQSTETGQALHRVIDTHRDEIMDLINTRRRVTVTWHRSQGSAYLAAFMRSAQDDAYVIPDDIRGISRRDVVLFMADALRDEGSDALRADIELFGARVTNALIECATVGAMLARLDTADDAVSDSMTEAAAHG